jgi:hypothetical protein
VTHRRDFLAGLDLVQRGKHKEVCHGSSGFAPGGL